MLSDRQDHRSCAANGPLRGRTIGELLDQTAKPCRTIWLSPRLNAWTYFEVKSQATNWALFRQIASHVDFDPWNLAALGLGNGWRANDLYVNVYFLGLSISSIS